MSEFRVVQSTAEMAEALAAIQAACFPTLAEQERITAEQFRAHTQVFPEGQLTVLDGARPVASTTTLRCNMDFDHYQHRYMDACGNNWLTTHNPQGDWLYGVDMGVHPDYRGRGLSSRLYEARKELVKRLNLRGQVAGGMPKGYGELKDRMSIDDYVKALNSGEIFDPTVSIQLRRGFKIRGVIYDYLDDPCCDNKGLLIVLPNPDYRP